MWPLVRRELDGMVTINLKRSFQTYVVFGLVLILLMWVLGPNVTDIFATELISLFLFLIGLLAAGMSLLSTMEEDAANRQLEFLQTLPVRKTDIVHAKFLSSLLLCGFLFVWVSILVSANLLINDVWTVESIRIVFLYLAVLMLLATGNLLWYFLRGSLHGGWINYALLLNGSVFLLYMGFYSPFGISKTFLFSISLAIAGFVYIGCWWLLAKRVKNKGFPKETDDPEREKIEKRAEELKRRYAERQAKKNRGSKQK
ncbi:ABC-2 transporter permease [Lentibacillus sp.]|uniref:ABC-2 transporter permease n=1 Tax=Lentibacillus sp. TaxID=1925746 RepID=UPI002B4AC22E|nr:ABC-2 transporter permease [Lentibacillus sp.]HLS10286.1 ABC-2 transporter permease [Lentibacillus sp.]